MNKEFCVALEKLDKQTVSLFTELDTLLHKSLTEQPDEKLWSKLPMYYIGNRSIILAPFNGHVNIVSNAAISHKTEVFINAVASHRDQLKDYKITPRGMLQIFCGQEIPKELLAKIFRETFGQE